MILENWIHLSMAKENNTAHNLTTIWYNKWFTANTLINKKFRKTTLSPSGLLRYGIRYLEDFFDCDGRLIQAEEAIARGLPKVARYEWDKVIRSIKNSKMDTSLVRGKYKRFNLNEPFQDHVTYRLGNTVLEGHQITQSRVLALFASNRETKPTTFVDTANKRFNLTKEDWKKIFSQVKKHSISTCKRSFIVKFFNKVTCTNIEFKRVQHTDSTKCNYCCEKKQDYYHLFWDCPGTREFRDAISCKWVMDDPLTLRNWCFGLFENNSPLNNAIAFIALEANNYIYSSNWNKEQLSITKFKAILYDCERVEHQIATESGKILKHFQKWDQIKNLI